ncbi:MAG: nitroreductase family deazaflavin-dependent oxidoreductase [Gammaproteobacteria bacterium]|jgi:proline iminopeptidase
MSDPIKDASETGWIAAHREQYLSDPHSGHMWDSSPAGGKGPIPTLLLTTVGRKSGKTSIMPLIYGEHDGSHVVIASKGGDPKHPGWYHNLMAQDEVTVQVIDDEFQAECRIAEGAERAKIWAELAELYPPYNDYAEKAGDRQIPVVILERIS